MAIAIRGTTPGTGTSTTATVSVTLNSTRQPQVDDVLVIIHQNDFFAASNMPTPTVGGSSSGVTAITNGAADLGSNQAHIKSYTKVITSAGDVTVSVTETGAGDEEKSLAVYVLSGADTSTPVDVAGNGGSTTSSASHDAPSISPTSTDAFLICAANGGTGAPGGGSYTPPSGMTEDYDVSVASAMTASGASLQLSASGATGTKSFTPAGSAPYATISVAMKTAAAGAGVVPYAGPWTAPTPGRVGPTGQWRVSLGDATTPLNVYVPAEAAATGAAFDATVAISPAAETTSATGSAFDATPDVQVNAETTTATGTAFDATVSADYGNNAGPWTGPTPGRIGPTGQWRVALGDATTPLNVYVPAEATATGTAFDATVDVGVAAETTAATGTALDATIDVQINAETTSGSGAAFDATTQVTSDLYAGPWRDITPGWISPTGQLNVLLGDAQETVSPDVTVNVPAAATATGAAFDATVDIGIAAELATASGAALDAVLALGAAADLATGAGTAFDAAVLSEAVPFAGPWTLPTPGRKGPTGRLSVLLGDATATVTVFNATSTDTVTAAVTSTATAASARTSTATVGQRATSTPSVSDG